MLSHVRRFAGDALNNPRIVQGVNASSGVGGLGKSPTAVQQTPELQQAQASQMNARGARQVEPESTQAPMGLDEAINELQVDLPPDAKALLVDGMEAMRFGATASAQGSPEPAPARGNWEEQAARAIGLGSAAALAGAGVADALDGQTDTGEAAINTALGIAPAAAGVVGGYALGAMNPSIRVEREAEGAARAAVVDEVLKLARGPRSIEGVINAMHAPGAAVNAVRNDPKNREAIKKINQEIANRAGLPIAEAIDRRRAMDGRLRRGVGAAAALGGTIAAGLAMRDPAQEEELS